MRYELYHVTAHGAPSSLLQFDVIYIFHRRHGFQQGQSFPQKKRSKRTASKELPQNDARSLVRCSIEKFVYILQEFIPRMCVSHKCVKGCGDERDINFVRTGLRFASERFFDGSHTHTHSHKHTYTHTHTHTHTHRGYNCYPQACMNSNC